MTTILAGNPEQAAVYAAAHGISEWVYIGDRPESCRGVRDCKVLLVRTWWRKKRIIALINELSMRGCVLRTVEDMPA